MQNSNDAPVAASVADSDVGVAMHQSVSVGAYSNQHAQQYDVMMDEQPNSNDPAATATSSSSAVNTAMNVAVASANSRYPQQSHSHDELEEEVGDQDEEEDEYYDSMKVEQEEVSDEDAIIPPPADAASSIPDRPQTDTSALPLPGMIRLVSENTAKREIINSILNHPSQIDLESVLEVIHSVKNGNQQENTTASMTSNSQQGANTAVKIEEGASHSMPISNNTISALPPDQSTTPSTISLIRPSPPAASQKRRAWGDAAPKILVESIPTSMPSAPSLELLPGLGVTAPKERIKRPNVHWDDELVAKLYAGVELYTKPTITDVAGVPTVTGSQVDWEAVNTYMQHPNLTAQKCIYKMNSEREKKSKAQRKEQIKKYAQARIERSESKEEEVDDGQMNEDGVMSDAAAVPASSSAVIHDLPPNILNLDFSSSPLPFESPFLTSPIIVPAEAALAALTVPAIGTIATPVVSGVEKKRLRSHASKYSYTALIYVSMNVIHLRRYRDQPNVLPNPIIILEKDKEQKVKVEEAKENEEMQDGEEESKASKKSSKKRSKRGNEEESIDEDDESTTKKKRTRSKRIKEDEELEKSEEEMEEKSDDEDEDESARSKKSKKEKKHKSSKSSKRSKRRHESLSEDEADKSDSEAEEDSKSKQKKLSSKSFKSHKRRRESSTSSDEDDDEKSDSDSITSNRKKKLLDSDDGASDASSEPKKKRSKRLHKLAVISDSESDSEHEKNSRSPTATDAKPKIARRSQPIRTARSVEDDVTMEDGTSATNASSTSSAAAAAFFSPVAATSSPRFTSRPTPTQPTQLAKPSASLSLSDSFSRPINPFPAVPPINSPDYFRIKKQIPCSFLLASKGCFRGDKCEFSHDPTAIQKLREFKYKEEEWLKTNKRMMLNSSTPPSSATPSSSAVASSSTSRILPPPTLTFIPDLLMPEVRLLPPPPVSSVIFKGNTAVTLYPASNAHTPPNADPAHIKSSCARMKRFQVCMRGSLTNGPASLGPLTPAMAMSDAQRVHDFIYSRCPPQGGSFSQLSVEVQWMLRIPPIPMKDQRQYSSYARGIIIQFRAHTSFDTLTWLEQINSLMQKGEPAFVSTLDKEDRALLEREEHEYHQQAKKKEHERMQEQIRIREKEAANAREKLRAELALTQQSHASSAHLPLLPPPTSAVVPASATAPADPRRPKDPRRSQTASSGDGTVPPLRSLSPPPQFDPAHVPTLPSLHSSLPLPPPPPPSNTTAAGSAVALQAVPTQISPPTGAVTIAYGSIGPVYSLAPSHDLNAEPQRSILGARKLYLDDFPLAPQCQMLKYDPVRTVDAQNILNTLQECGILAQTLLFIYRHATTNRVELQFRTPEEKYQAYMNRASLEARGIHVWEAIATSSSVTAPMQPSLATTTPASISMPIPPPPKTINLLSPPSTLPQPSTVLLQALPALPPSAPRSTPSAIVKSLPPPPPPPPQTQSLPPPPPPQPTGSVASSTFVTPLSGIPSTQSARTLYSSYGVPPPNGSILFDFQNHPYHIFTLPPEDQLVNPHEIELNARRNEARRRQFLLLNYPTPQWKHQHHQQSGGSVLASDRYADADRIRHHLIQCGVIHLSEVVRWLNRLDDGRIVMQMAEERVLDQIASRDPSRLHVEQQSIQRADGTWLIAPKSGTSLAPPRPGQSVTSLPPPPPPPPSRPFLGAAVHTPRFEPSDPRPPPRQQTPQPQQHSQQQQRASRWDTAR